MSDVAFIAAAVATPVFIFGLLVLLEAMERWADRGNS